MRTIVGTVLDKIPRPTPAMVVALLALLVAASGAAVAAGSFTASDGTITACRDNRSGTLRVINATNQTCTSKETTITWKDGITGKVADSAKLGGLSPTDFLRIDQKATDSDKLDGMDSTEFAKSYKRTVVVSPVGTPIENGTALKNALGNISNASESNPYLLKIEPGIYDVDSGTTPLNMKSYVDVEGSGEGVTTITATGSGGIRTGTVVGAANSELRSLTVKSHGGTIAVAIYDNASNFQLTSMTATVSDGTVNFGLVADQNSTVMLNQTTVTASGSGQNYGILTNGNTQVRNSRIAGATRPIENNGTTRVAASQLEGGAVNGSVTCAGVYDENFTFFANTCP